MKRLLLSKICLICIKQQKLRLYLFKGFARCKRSQDSPGFWIPFHGFRIPHEGQSKTVSLKWNGFQAVDSGFQVLDSGSFVSGTWILDFNRQWDSGFLELYSWFQSPGFQIPQQKFRIQDHDSLTWDEKVYPQLGRFLVSLKVLVFVLVSQNHSGHQSGQRGP